MGTLCWSSTIQFLSQHHYKVPIARFYLNGQVSDISTICDLLTKTQHFSIPLNFIVLGPVVPKVDSVIHWINHYPVDNAIGLRTTYPLDRDLSGG